MLTITESVTTARLIRWTADEWTRIASCLCLKKGTVQSALLNLGEVKAKDVFIAQQVLPADRHRKLVSIAQGFDGIRTRLSAILQSLPRAGQDDFFQPEDLACGDEKEEQGETSDVDGLALGRAGRSQEKVDSNEANEAVPPEPQAAYGGSTTVAVDPVGLRRMAQLTTGVGEPIAEQSLRSDATLEAPAGGAQHKGLPPAFQPTPYPAATILIEAARPFIKMVCEEFVQAFVTVLSNQEVRHALQTGTSNSPGLRAASTQAAFDARQNAAGQASPELDNAPQSPSSIADHLFRPVSLSRVQEDGVTDRDEAEVQPLFDPKLPPSANSGFKPNIGVVATQTNDLQELRQLFPQLNLTIVQADCVSDVRCFGHCQRIIALRDEVPPATDKLLSRLLRHRYVRLGGGISGIKDQLNAWLNAPGSISSPSKRVMPRYGTEPVGGMVKKEQNRYPRMIVR
jgi:hypothetical protein